jgi:L-asparaginase
MKNESIKIISCGGTFEKVYNPISGELVFEKSHINGLIKKSRMEKNITVENILMIDSLHMTDQHRNKIADCVLKSSESKILIVHGTDTMVKTGEIVARKRKQDQTIIITGAMVPVSIKDSDAFFQFWFRNSFIRASKVRRMDCHEWLNI